MVRSPSPALRPGAMCGGQGVARGPDCPVSRSFRRRGQTFSFRASGQLARPGKAGGDPRLTRFKVTTQQNRRPPWARSAIRRPRQARRATNLEPPQRRWLGSASDAASGAGAGAASAGACGRGDRWPSWNAARASWRSGLRAHAKSAFATAGRSPPAAVTITITAPPGQALRREAVRAGQRPCPR